MSLEVRIDRAVCAGTANCQFWAPEVFDLDDDNKAVVMDPEAAPEEQVRLAAEGCPTGAISVFRDDERLAP